MSRRERIREDMERRARACGRQKERGLRHVNTTIVVRDLSRIEARAFASCPWNRMGRYEAKITRILSKEREYITNSVD